MKQELQGRRFTRVNGESSMTVQEIYDSTIRPLPAGERLQLATLILKGIPPEAVVDYSEEWSEEDMRDFSRMTWENAAKSFQEDEDASSW